MKMTKNQAFELAVKIGGELADYLGMGNVMVQKESDGYWLWESIVGVDGMKKTFGDDYRKAVKWENNDGYVEVDWFWDSPRVCVRMENGDLASLSISDFNNDTREHDGNYHLGEMQIFRDGGLNYAKMLISRWMGIQSGEETNAAD